MKHVSRKYKKRTLRKNKVLRKNRKTIVKRRNYKKRNTRKRRRVGGMYEEEDIEIGIKKPPSIFINPNLVPSTTLKPPTPTNEPSSWKGLQRTSKQNIEKYLKKGDFSRPPLTDSQEDRELLAAYYPQSDNEYKTPRSSISSESYGTPRIEEEYDDPILSILDLKNPEERKKIYELLKPSESSSSEEEQSEDEETRKAIVKQKLKATMKEFGIE